ncbi:hypothetical protein [Paenibacillus glycanilyticus]|uniref:Uncharacterized protein n=1 Tax=Paenibacillus glycanilyticus TaxID=126569 RepID=A0ABQ6GJ53_9BACL|nr:hypothetical protein [Paenibacillus glycanilyticus]GLX70265.1 hypothetical protein MU1_46110 [Paenibacillus glycanilyticus]
MDNQPFKHMVRTPSGVKSIFAITGFCLLFVIAEMRGSEESTAVQAVAIALFCLCAAGLLWSIYRAAKKPIALCLQEDAILINGRTITAREIEVIMLRRDSVHPIIGIKPYGASVVPVRNCFRYADEEDRGFADLAEWAMRNNVKVDNNIFFRWL